MNFSEKFLNYFYHLDHASECDAVDDGVVTARVGEAINQDVVQFSFAIKDARIESARFKAAGSPAMLAAAECVCCWVEGKSVVDVDRGLTPELVLGLLELNEHHTHIATLVCQGVTACLQNI